jgi:glycosyltransferase involved in cell wall biosynthesis/peptidoglycan/xylan/chitin deacetylase (PgdA/CDA1 family)
MFHRVLPQNEDCYDAAMATSKEAFADILDWLTENFRIVPLEELVSRRGKPFDKKKAACAITFDDGWRDNFVHAFPVLRERKLPATIFLPLQFIGTKRRFWQERLSLCIQGLQPIEYRKELITKVARRFPWFPPAPEILAPDGGLKRFLMTRPSEEAEEFVQHLVESAGLSGMFSDRVFLNWDEVLAMRDSGISFGSHTLNHLLLTNMQPARAIVEIRESRRELQERLSVEVSGFSYPWGAASSLTRDAIRETGYSYAVSTRPGLVKDRSDPWLLPRMASNSLLESGAKFKPDMATLSCAKILLFAKVRTQKPLANAGRIRIAFVIDQISEWEGGTERQLHALISALDRNYFDPQLCFIFAVPGFPADTLPCQARWICPDPARIPPLAIRLFRLALVLREMRPHIVQTFFIEGIFAGILAARLANVPTVVGSARNAGHWKKRRHRIAFRAVARAAHQWQCNSRALWEYTNKTEGVSPNRIEILPNAIDLSRFNPPTQVQRLAMRQKLGLSDCGPIFVSVAALTPVKDIRTLLAAVDLVKRQLPAAQFLLVGEGPLRKDLEQQSEKLGLSQMVRFVGRQPDVQPYLAAADYGVFTSLSEGSSNALLEYMAMGLPSVVSDIEPNRELVDGLFFSPGDATDLARKLFLIGTDSALGTKLRSDYLAAASQYSSEKFALRVQGYYSKLAAGKNYGRD